MCNLRSSCLYIYKTLFYNWVILPCESQYRYCGAHDAVGTGHSAATVAYTTKYGPQSCHCGAHDAVGMGRSAATAAHTMPLARVAVPPLRRTRCRAPLILSSSRERALHVPMCNPLLWVCCIKIQFCLSSVSRLPWVDVFSSSDRSAP